MDEDNAYFILSVIDAFDVKVKQLISLHYCVCRRIWLIKGIHAQSHFRGFVHDIVCTLLRRILSFRSMVFRA